MKVDKDKFEAVVNKLLKTYSFDGCNTTTYIDGNADEGYQCTTNKSDKTITVTCVKSVEKAK